MVMQTTQWPWCPELGQTHARLARAWGDANTRVVLTYAFAHLADIAETTEYTERAARLMRTAHAYFGAGQSGEWVNRYSPAVIHAMIRQADEEAARLGVAMQVAELLKHLPRER